MRTYTKKTHRGETPKEIYEAAAEKVLQGKSLRKAADEYNVNFMTLQRFVKKIRNSNNEGKLLV